MCDAACAHAMIVWVADLVAATVELQTLDKDVMCMIMKRVVYFRDCVKTATRLVNNHAQSRGRSDPVGAVPRLASKNPRLLS